jgi:hypothetical protein
MFRSWGVSTAIAILSFAAAALAQQSGPQPTARELFYQAAPAPAKNTQPAKSASHPRPPAPARSQTTSVTPPPAPPPDSGGAAPARTTEASANGSVPIIKASAETGPPLGLRYSIVRLVDGKMVEVSPDFVFHAGDHIQLKVQTNAVGYLYVVSQGSSGTWTPIFPSPAIANGDNRVDGWHTYTLPNPDYQIGFDTQTGTENVTIVFSREPVPDFEDLIYSLQGRHTKPVSQPQSGEPAVAPQPKGMVMMASVRIDDDVVGRLRNASARDLIVEHVDTATPPDASGGDKKETAVYVVNPAGSPDSRLVADLHLVHR